MLPPGASYRGLTYGEWGAAFWQWAFSLPAEADHPFFPGGDPLKGQSGPVVFLPGVFGGDERAIEIPAGTALFFPVINAECSFIEPDPFHGEDEDEMRACAKGWMDEVSGLAVQIDGRAVKDVSAWRTESPLFELGPLPENNLLLAEAGATSDAVDAGYYLLLVPLSVGEHTVHFQGTFDAWDATVEATYHVRVLPRRR